MIASTVANFLFTRSRRLVKLTWKVFSQTEKGHDRLTTRTVQTTTEMNEWFASEWAGISQTFQVTRTAKKRQSKLINLLEAGEQTTSHQPAKQG